MKAKQSRGAVSRTAESDPLRTLAASSDRAHPDNHFQPRRSAMMKLFLGVALTFPLLLPAMADDNSIIGTWRFQSFVREVIATGERQNEFGEKPGGYISYQPDGRMFAMLVADNRIKPSGASPTDE